MDLLRMRARRNILRAYRRFKQEILCADRKTIWDNAEKILFVKNVVEYYMHSETIPEVFYQMAVAEPELLNLMYLAYEKGRGRSEQNGISIDTVLEQILLNWEYCAA